MCVCEWVSECARYVCQKFERRILQYPPRACDSLTTIHQLSQHYTTPHCTQHPTPKHHYHTISYHTITCYSILHLTTPHYTTSFHKAPHHSISYHSIKHHTTKPHTTPLNTPHHSTHHSTHQNTWPHILKSRVNWGREEGYWVRHSRPRKKIVNVKMLLRFMLLILTVSFLLTFLVKVCIIYE